jgi:BASS family bile acid:Na+ symporter
VTDALPSLVPLVAMLVMGIVGLELAPADFARWRVDARRLGAIVLCQWVVAFGVALLLARVPQVPPTGAAGLLLLAAAPAAPLANFYATLARGRVAVAVTVTGISSVAATVITPLAASAGLWLAADTAVAVAPPLADLARQVGLVLLLPMAAGMALRWQAPAWVAARRQWFTLLGMAAIGSLVTAVLVDQWSTVRGALARHAVLTVAYTLPVLAAGALVVPRVRGLAADRRALVWSFPARSTAIAIALAAGGLRDPGIIGFLAVALVVQMPLLTGLAYWAGRRSLP